LPVYADNHAAYLWQELTDSTLAFDAPPIYLRFAGNDLIALFHDGGLFLAANNERKRVEAVASADAMRRAAVFGEHLFESRDLVAEDIATGIKAPVSASASSSRWHELIALRS